jgi:hypothetical protein
MANEENEIIDIFSGTDLEQTLINNPGTIHEKSLISSRIQDSLSSTTHEGGDQTGDQTVRYKSSEKDFRPGSDEIITTNIDLASSKPLHGARTRYHDIPENLAISKYSHLTKKEKIKAITAEVDSGETLTPDSETSRFIQENADMFTDVFRKKLSVGASTGTWHHQTQEIKNLDKPGMHSFENFNVLVLPDGTWEAEFQRDTTEGGKVGTERIQGGNVIDLVKSIKDFGPMTDVSRFFEKLNDDNEAVTKVENPNLKTGTQDIEDTLVNKWTAPGSIYS